MFHIAIEEPEEIIPRLGRGLRHWKKGRSAYELAVAWTASPGIPDSVRSVLDQAPEWRGAQLLDAVFERPTDLGTAGAPSQTDLLAVVGLPAVNAVLAVEGKVDEPFGEVVDKWLGTTPAPGKIARLKGLCATLGLETDIVGDVHYQLLHRTCAAIYEARRLRYPCAMMLVHSFDALGAWFDKFEYFARSLEMPVAAPNAVSPARLFDGISLRLAWVKDSVCKRQMERWQTPEVEGVFTDDAGRWCSNASSYLDDEDPAADENPPREEWEWHQSRPARGNSRREDWKAWLAYLSEPHAGEGLRRLAEIEARRTLRLLGEGGSG
ncbi:MAG: hypothetical protein LCH56_03495 [Proteobacteria bacterium]|nr:hypothetical protein [Pseudomonadota bacterium]